MPQIKPFLNCLFVVLCLMSCTACGDDQSGEAIPADGDSDQALDGDLDVESDDEIDQATLHLTCSDDTGLVMETPDTYSSFVTAGFTRYASVEAPNGHSIPIFAQDKVTDEMIIRARNLLLFYLENVPESLYGADKREVANKMTVNQAALIMPNGADGEGAEPSVMGQPLYEKEISVEGSNRYMQNDYEHRDASFEEIFHMVHDFGIGTDAPGALPDYQQALLEEAEKALTDGRWGIPIDPEVTSWIEELRQEGSLAQEYIASVIDSYYGLWGAWTEANGGMWGIYIAKTRQEVETLDPAGKTLLEQFLSPKLTFHARISSELTGDFSMEFDSGKPYTHKSQYLIHAILTGTNDSNLFGNEEDNTLRGNTGNNTLDGKDGHDTVVYCRPNADYTLLTEGSNIVVNGPDGTDTLVNIEQIQFADQIVQVSELQ